ncbi:MAG: DMT family transporter [Planctomycetes bacterium]|nr:DMT family transporter [Planctomycetota bacterium]
MGELLSLGSALCWAIGLLLFRFPLAHRAASEVNLFKCAFAALLLGLTALAALGGGALAFDGRCVLLIAISGVIGMSLGDTLLFHAMSRLGPTRALMLQSTNPLVATLFAWLWLGEALTGLQLLGIATCSVGTLLVIAEGRAVEQAGERGHGFGIAAGLGASVAQAAGMLLVREALLGTSGGAGSGFAAPCAAAALRLGAGALALLLPALWRSPRATAQLLGARAAWREMALPSFIGTYLGLLAMTIALDLSPTGIVSALSSTTPLFLLGIGVIWLRERHGFLSYGGVALGVLGAILLVL